MERADTAKVNVLLQQRGQHLVLRGRGGEYNVYSRLNRQHIADDLSRIARGGAPHHTTSSIALYTEAGFIRHIHVHFLRLLSPNYQTPEHFLSILRKHCSTDLHGLQETEEAFSNESAIKPLKNSL